MDGIHSQQGGSSEHLILEVRGGKRGLTSSMIDDETYFVSMRCGGTRNERSSGTLVESLHSYESQKCRPVGYFSRERDARESRLMVKSAFDPNLCQTHTAHRFMPRSQRKEGIDHVHILKLSTRHSIASRRPIFVVMGCLAAL